MKLKLSKNQWRNIGHKAGWIREAIDGQEPSVIMTPDGTVETSSGLPIEIIPADPDAVTNIVRSFGTTFAFIGYRKKEGGYRRFNLQSDVSGYENEEAAASVIPEGLIRIYDDRVARDISEFMRTAVDRMSDAIRNLSGERLLREVRRRLMANPAAVLDRVTDVPISDKVRFCLGWILRKSDTPGFKEAFVDYLMSPPEDEMERAQVKKSLLKEFKKCANRRIYPDKVEIMRGSRKIWLVEGATEPENAALINAVREAEQSGPPGGPDSPTSMAGFGLPITYVRA